jgi:Protein of unknown function (DUF3313)
MKHSTSSHVPALARAGALLAVMVGLAGCAVQAPGPTGFLGDRTDPRPDNHGNSGLPWSARAGFDGTQCKRLMLDPLVVHLPAQALGSGLSPETPKRLSDESRDIVVAERSPDRPVANQPGADVLRIHAAIIDVVPASPALNVLTTVVAFVPMDMGGASLENEFLDSQTGARPAAMAGTRRGTRTELKGGSVELGPARSAMKPWAVALKTALPRRP